MESDNKFSLLSIIIPAYNEETSIESILTKVLDANCCDLQVEIIVVDDFSKDRTFEIASELVPIPQ